MKPSLIELIHHIGWCIFFLFYLAITKNGTGVRTRAYNFLFRVDRLTGLDAFFDCFLLFWIGCATGLETVNSVGVPLVLGESLIQTFWYANRRGSIAGERSKERKYSASVCCSSWANCSKLCWQVSCSDWNNISTCNRLKESERRRRKTRMWASLKINWNKLKLIDCLQSSFKIRPNETHSFKSKG